MSKNNIIILLCLGTSLCGSANNWQGKGFFCSPGITVGYTFHAKMNYGFFIDAGRVTSWSNTTLKYGFSFHQYYVVTDKYIHRLRSFSVMGQTDFVDLKIGLGRARNKWGRNNGNKCITHGINFDLSFALPNIYSPWLGFRYFIYPASTWAWFMYPYESIYVKYKYDVIQNTDLKNRP